MPNDTDIKYYKISDAIEAPINSHTVFIIANEKITTSGKIGRYYTIFPTFRIFLDNRSQYPHCHEILVDHVNNKPNIGGRLVFDFDIKFTNEITASNIPKNFTFQIETTITAVIDNYFNDVDTNKFIFVWSTSKNPTKFSKHLTVKNLYFDDWITMSKCFYKFFCEIWDSKYWWIHSSDLIDCQIVRAKGSLRMVGSKKINGHSLEFDNPDHILTDSLIRIYFKNRRQEEQLVTYLNINKNGHDELNNDISLVRYSGNNGDNGSSTGTGSNRSNEPLYPKKIYNKVYQMINKIMPDIFTMGKISGKYLSLIRTKSYPCLLSKKVHDHENAYCTINVTNDIYHIYFGCYRSCHEYKKYYVGSLTIDDLIDVNNPDFDMIIDRKYKMKIYQRAYEVINQIAPNTFIMDKISGNAMLLIRQKKNKCIISRTIHKKDNAYIIIEKTTDSYLIKYGCFRPGCKLCCIGSLNIKTLDATIKELFDPKNAQLYLNC